MSSSVPMPFATDGAVGVASCALVARIAHGSKGLRQRHAVQKPISVQSQALARHSEPKWLESRANTGVCHGALKRPSRGRSLDFHRQSDWRHKARGCTGRPNELPGNDVPMHRYPYREQLVLGAKRDVVLVQLVCAWAAVASAQPTMIAANAVPRADCARS